MNVLFISECSGRALKETRRILDQFAERRGERTWQTAITMAGLEAVRTQLRKTARKNTSVACHWIRGIDNTELMWIVGNRKRFNLRGAVPTNTTTRKIVRKEFENSWHTLQDIYLLSGMAALLHDLGKSCAAFQARLLKNEQGRNLYRHEWISLRLFQAFVGSDDDRTWLLRMIRHSMSEDNSWLTRLEMDGLNAKSSTPFKHLPPLAQAIGWIVVSHHRLPLFPRNSDTGFQSQILYEIPGCITADWNETCNETSAEKIRPYWEFPKGLPVDTSQWKLRAAKYSTRLLDRIDTRSECDYLDDPFLMHLARLCMMLADHNYSALTDEKDRISGTKGYPLFANTNRKTGELNQPLDEHLLGVEKFTGQTVYSLPKIAESLPRLAGHRGLRKRSDDKQFRWQDRVAELAESVRERADKQGAFVINMASTGCGKTLANARIMYGLAGSERGMRCAFALGLRTLTRQTGLEYRERLSLSDDDVAVLVGGSAQSLLIEHFSKQAESSGSESSQSLIPEDGHVIYDGTIEDHHTLQRLCRDPRSKAKELIGAPILVCTIDHLVPATESTRGGRQITPMLRLLSSDLVLDELDDYDIDDLPAVARLMNWAGLLGCRVLISSATLAPSLVQGMFEAYSNGRKNFQRSRGERPTESPPICGIWIDEFACAQVDCGDMETFREAHKAFTEKRAKQLSTCPVLRRARIAEFPISGEETTAREQFAKSAIENALALHDSHGECDAVTGKKVSFGLVRMANIEPLFDAAVEMYRLGAPENYRIHLCVYHARFPAIIRSATESILDRALNRRKTHSGLDCEEARLAYESCKEPNQVFIVLSSPISEVGRDHDYDWAVVEPSSLRSIIQIAGRVQRHRKKLYDEPNIVLLNSNLRAVEKPNEPAFQRPGFESSEVAFRLKSKSLSDLLRDHEYRSIDSRPRILEGVDIKPREYLADLEHGRLRRLMGAEEIAGGNRPLTNRELRAGVARNPGLGAYTWWHVPRASLTGILQSEQEFRRQTRSETELVLLPKDGIDDYEVYKLGDDISDDVKLTPIDRSLHHRVKDSELTGLRIQSWPDFDFVSEFEALQNELELDARACGLRFATVKIHTNSEGWRSSPKLGFSEYKIKGKF